MTFEVDGEPVQAGGPEDRLLPWDRVQEMAGISRTTAWRMERSGAFPSRVTVSPGRVGWWQSELTAWKGARALARPLAAPSRSPQTPKALTPPAVPRLPGMARRAPVRSDGETAPHAAAVQPELPMAAPEPARPSKPRSRNRHAATGQIDFGF